MHRRQTRRSFVAKLAAGAGVAVVGFDPARRGWATENSGPLVGLPRLEGRLVTDAAALDEVSQDNGRMVSRRPLAVLRPGGVADVVRIVRYANEHGLKVAMRGQGHSSYGQAQVEAGVVIDSRPLRRVRKVSDREVHVEAGATFDEVVAATLTRGRTIPVLPDTQVLTVGGTLSIGGTGNASHRQGAIVDHARELEIVTGRGERLVCSPTANRELFEMALAGLGQCALIVSAKIGLETAPDHVTLRDHDYDDLDAFLDDQRNIARDGSVDHLGGRVLLRRDGKNRFRLTTGSYVGKLHGRRVERPAIRGAQSGPERRVAYLDYLHRTLPLIERGKQSGSWWWPSPSAMFFVPDSDAMAFVTDSLSDPVHLEGTELFDGYAFLAAPTRHFNRPLLPFPREPLAFQAWIIRRAPTERVPAVLDANYKLWERVKAKGGERYAGYGAVPFTPADWARHYGAAWARLQAAKKTYDPKNVLTPGPGMFV
jgi:FAD/FMN-containing dehydrogenase